MDEYTTADAVATVDLGTTQQFDVFLHDDEPSEIDFRCDTITERLSLSQKGAWRYSVTLRGGRLLRKVRVINGVETRRTHARFRDVQGWTWPAGWRHDAAAWARVAEHVEPHLVGPDVLWGRLSDSIGTLVVERVTPDVLAQPGPQQ